LKSVIARSVAARQSRKLDCFVALAMTEDIMESLVSTDWLAEHLAESDLVVVDASWHMPVSGRVGHDEYLAAHIPGARFFDIDEISDRSNPAPHMLPSSDQFAAAMEELGIGRGNRIVVYDNSPIRTAARGWFTLRHFGAEKVAILDGGFQKWLAEGRPTEGGEPAPREARFTAEERHGEVVTKQQILAGEFHSPLLDARGKGRFEGTDPDPRPGVAAGHIPGAANLPFGTLYEEDGTFKPAGELRRLFEEARIDPARPFTASCGSGVTASSLIFAAHLLGNDASRLYDGSWSEWGADPATAKAVGPA
jgi:thiosulfate/3-mercaptopyruvate sulfurtransferase